ncbi:hypothetical protein [Bradyrhizobium genosp. SA-3]|uniref:hypothetical protein n=1 Tax=Bradyrhizobium genosp. SA-3 TaxID=508868 RepID=UPI0013EE4B62|nr:hypothetical protein [Bradyrhizobium genosp. SA-3]
MTKFPMTSAGHAALQGELSRRIRIERSDLVRRIRQAIADEPNLVENSEYQVALAEQSVNEARIADLESKLARAEVVHSRRHQGLSGPQVGWSGDDQEG